MLLSQYERYIEILHNSNPLVVILLEFTDASADNICLKEKLKELSGQYSGDIPILIVLLWFSIVHYSSLFQYFVYRSTIVPTL